LFLALRGHKHIAVGKAHGPRYIKIYSPERVEENSYFLFAQIYLSPLRGWMFLFFLYPWALPTAICFQPFGPKLDLSKKYAE